MSIYKLNSKLTSTRKFELLNDMVLELEGLVEKGRFNKNELTQIFTDESINRKFLRDVSLGHSLTTYATWTHIQSETGYSIWRFAPSNYIYNSLNQLYLDGKKLENRGEASVADATTFDYIYLYNGDSASGYTDNTTEAGTETGTAFDGMNSINDYLYIGHTSTFSGMKFEFSTRGSNYTLKLEYYSNESGYTWRELTANTNALDEDTSNFESDGKISWTIPSDWATTIVNSQTKYWIRISTTTTPVTTASIYYLIPYNSVISLLSMSSTQLLNEDWAWCSYDVYIYVTIRNTGNTDYEGDYYIASGSSTTNKQNFFIYNHEYTLDYQDSTYVAGSTLANLFTIKTGENVVDGSVVYLSGTMEVGLADALDSTKPALGIATNCTTTTCKLSTSGVVSNVKTIGDGNIVVGDKLYLVASDMSGTLQGVVSKVLPINSGNLVQFIGRAVRNEESGNVVDVFASIDHNPSLV